MARDIRGRRYLDAMNTALEEIARDVLPYADYEEALEIYETIMTTPTVRAKDIAFLGCNDRFFMLTVLLHRKDALHPWLYDRAREVEGAPDGYLDLWAREHYKALALGEPVPTPSGWRPHGDLRPGDWVFGPDGEPTRVVACTLPFTDAPAYELTFDDGTTMRAGADHLWTVERHTRRRVPMTHKDGVGKRVYRETVTLSTREIAEHDHRPDKRLAIPVNAPIRMPGAILPISPYTLGAWLGDGHSADGRVTCGDCEVFDAIRAEGWELSEDGRKAPGAETRTVYGLRPILNSIGILHNKAGRLPMDYLRGSAAQRLELLRGLMDTDGHCSTRGTATFVNKTEPVAQLVYDLATGLGMKPQKREYTADHGIFWQVSFQAYQAAAPFRIARKVARCKPGERPNPRRYIVSVRPIEPEPMSCIQVDRPDGLYLAGRQMVTTHNSTIITFAGAIQECLADPEITIGLFSHTKDAAQTFLGQIMQEFEGNDLLRECYADVLWLRPRTQSPSWSTVSGITLNRVSNPKEATIEAHGLLDGMPTGRHFQLMIYDDLITEKHVTNNEVVKKVTTAWELSDNLGAGMARKWHIGTRYHFGDTYGMILDTGALKARLYAATDDGTMSGNLVFMPRARWEDKVKTQRSTLAAQMLQNPTAGKETTFQPHWFTKWEVRPSVLNVYIMIDPSGGKKAGSDRTAMAVVGVDISGNKYLLDGFCHRMPLSDRWRNLTRLRKKWLSQVGVREVKVGYEKYGMQSDLEYFEEKMTANEDHFEIKELNWPNSGGHSKRDRVQRLEPDVKYGRFKLPAVIYVPGVGECYWHMDANQQRKVTVPVKGPTRNQRMMIDSGQAYRCAKSIRALDQEEKSYDLTSALIEEMLFFPFAPHDDLVDAASRIYDMEIVTPGMSDAQADEINALDWEDA